MLFSLLSTAAAFINMDEVDYKAMDVKSFDFQVTYELDILALKHSTVKDEYVKFLEELTEKNVKQIEDFIETVPLNSSEGFHGHMNPRVFADQFKAELTEQLDDLAKEHTAAYLAKLRGLDYKVESEPAIYAGKSKYETESAARVETLREAYMKAGTAAMFVEVPLAEPIQN